MRIVNPRYWAGLVSSLLLFGTLSVGAQEFRLSPAPPPHVAQCMETMNAYGNYLIMRRAEITREEAKTAFVISVKLSRYLLKMQGHTLTSEMVEIQRAGIDLVYDLSDADVADNATLEAWMNGNMTACIADNAPTESPGPPVQEGDQNIRMIPS